MPASVRIVARTNGVGIDRDVRILADALAASGVRTGVSHHRAISPLRRLFDPGEPEDCIIFLERIRTRWLRRGRRHVLIPNQERYPERQVRLLRHADRILVKSRHAFEIFARHHPDVRFTGFTSFDRSIPDIVPDYGRFCHLAGGSGLKGTATLIDVWARHPEWPTLTVLFHRRGADIDPPPNVELIREYLDDDALRRLQAGCGVHVCTSLSEGWGHYIVEAMSCSALVLTTDGPPMHEIVRPDRGILVPWRESAPRKMGTNFFVDPDRLEQSIEAVLAMPEAERAALGRAGRVWFETNDREFRTCLAEALHDLLPLQPATD